jgi:hypothetical protein
MNKMESTISIEAPKAQQRQQTEAELTTEPGKCEIPDTLYNQNNNIYSVQQWKWSAMTPLLVNIYDLYDYK